MLGKLSVPGLIWIIVGQGPKALEVDASGSCLDNFSLAYLFSFLSLSLGDGPIKTEILSQRAVKPLTTNQPNQVVSGMRTPFYCCHHVFSKVSDKNACRSIDSDLTTHSTILDSISRRFDV